MLLAQTVINDTSVKLIIGVLMLAGTFALLLTDRPVPDVLWALDGSIVTFYFVALVTRAAKDCP